MTYIHTIQTIYNDIRFYTFYIVKSVEYYFKFQVTLGLYFRFTF